ncbi:MAG: SDR family oxidoreductase [Gemmatimonadales bacterium]|nr:MAG: SDR family oxidoreductase [Gemmatimonadales bacterium]
MEMKDRVAFITGAGSGIGRATARRLVAEGMRVALAGRDEDELEELAEEIRNGGGEALAMKLDIVEVDELEAAYAKIDETWGRLDLVFANAGVNGTWAPIEELDPEDWRQTIEINLTGTFQTIKYAVPYLKQSKGQVIITSSINGTRVFSNTGATAYACSKGAQVVLGRMLALELAADGIRVNVICPGAVDTAIDDNTELENLKKVRHPESVPDDVIPLTGGEPASSEQVAALVMMLVSDESSHITGTEIWIDGGQSLLKG